MKSSRNHKAEYLLHKRLELKGDQKTFYINILKESYPDLVEKYEKLYKNSYIPDKKYISKINNNVSRLCNNYGLKNIL